MVLDDKNEDLNVITGRRTRKAAEKCRKNIVEKIKNKQLWHMYIFKSKKHVQILVLVKVILKGYTYAGVHMYTPCIYILIFWL